MKDLHVSVANKIATYQKRDGDIVCGNKYNEEEKSGYQIKFIFDDEWSAYEKKIARFIFGGQFEDVEFTGDTCPVPILSGVTLCKVGVYAGDLCTTTSASIGCKTSILCKSAIPTVENDKYYANEARKYAEEAKQYAEEAGAGGGSGSGSPGKDGATFTPSVSKEGVLSWTNDKGLDNPDPVDISGSDGHTPIIGNNGNWWIDGTDTKVKAKGIDGVGILKVEKTATNGNIDTYTITYTNGSTFTFTVTNGLDGFSPTVSAEAINGGHRVIITDKNGEKKVNILNGADGRGISSVLKTSTNGLVDTYTITFTDNTTSTFTVTNGKEGTSVTIEEVSESTADGGSNTVTFSDGKTLTVKNGSKGSTGDKGDSGVYIGETEPTDDSVNVWINPNSGVAIIPTIEHNTCSIFRKVVCVGDSYTSGHIQTDGDAIATNEDYSWVSYMARLTGNEYVNCGSSGATTITWLNHSRGLAKAKSTGVVQAYLVGLGLNDVNGVGGITLGTAADIGTDAQTYYAGMSRIVRELNAISPKAKIFLQTMPSVWDENKAHNAAIRKIVEVYSDTYPVHLLDLEAYLPMYKTDLILGDKINGHYTAIGYQMFAENLRVIWSEYINNHIADFQDVYTLPYDTN